MSGWDATIIVCRRRATGAAEPFDAWLARTFRCVYDRDGQPGAANKKNSRPRRQGCLGPDNNQELPQEQ